MASGSLLPTWAVATTRNGVWPSSSTARFLYTRDQHTVSEPWRHRDRARRRSFDGWTELNLRSYSSRTRLRSTRQWSCEGERSNRALAVMLSWGTVPFGGSRSDGRTNLKALEAITDCTASVHKSEPLGRAQLLSTIDSVTPVRRSRDSEGLISQENNQSAESADFSRMRSYMETKIDFWLAAIYERSRYRLNASNDHSAHSRSAGGRRFA
jgi:hypothetical protein